MYSTNRFTRIKVHITIIIYGVNIKSSESFGQFAYETLYLVTHMQHIKCC